MIRAHGEEVIRGVAILHAGRFVGRKLAYRRRRCAHVGDNQPLDALMACITCMIRYTKG